MAAAADFVKVASDENNYNYSLSDRAISNLVVREGGIVRFANPNVKASLEAKLNTVVSKINRTARVMLLKESILFVIEASAGVADIGEQVSYTGVIEPAPSKMLKIQPRYDGISEKEYATNAVPKHVERIKTAIAEVALSAGGRRRKTRRSRGTRKTRK